LTFERGPFVKNSSRITKISLLIFGLLLLASASWAQKCPPAAEKIAQAYGIDSFGQIDAVRSTFNIDFPGLRVVCLERLRATKEKLAMLVYVKWNSFGLRFACRRSRH
jgi:hypothetical protein